MTRLLTPLILAFGLVGIAAMPAWAGDIRSERVQFPKGEIGATIKDRIKGREAVDYRLRARAGQRMNVRLYTDNPSNYFNVIAPGETDVAFFIGSNEGNRFESNLPASGDYRIRVYLYRNAARRGEVANYRLEATVTSGKSQSDSAGYDTAASDASVGAGQGDFDATGQVPCAQHRGQPMGQCRFGVSRAGGGTATVVVTKPDGSTRAIFFIDGKANSADTSQADGYGEFSARREADLNLIRVGDERYEIPDAAIYGG